MVSRPTLLSSLIAAASTRAKTKVESVPCDNILRPKGRSTVEDSLDQHAYCLHPKERFCLPYRSTWTAARVVGTGIYYDYQTLRAQKTQQPSYAGKKLTIARVFTLILSHKERTLRK